MIDKTEVKLRRLISLLRDEVELAATMLNSLGYFSCDGCGEWKKGIEDLCSHCQRKEEEACLIYEMNL